MICLTCQAKGVIDGEYGENSRTCTTPCFDRRLARPLTGWDRAVRSERRLSRSLRTISIHYSLSSFTAAAAAAPPFIPPPISIETACLPAASASPFPPHSHPRVSSGRNERITIHRILS